MLGILNEVIRRTSSSTHPVILANISTSSLSLCSRLWSLSSSESPSSYRSEAGVFNTTLANFASSLAWTKGLVGFGLAIELDRESVRRGGGLGGEGVVGKAPGSVVIINGTVRSTEDRRRCRRRRC